MRNKFIIVLDLHDVLNIELLLSFFVFSIVNSLFIVLLLSSMVAMIIHRAVCYLPSVWLIVCDILHITRRSQKHSVVQMHMTHTEVTFLGLREMYTLYK